MNASRPPSLPEYLAKAGLPTDWHIGPEHPALEELGIRLLAHTTQPRVLELGVQSGGFAVPVILATADRDGFTYTGVDNLEYTNAVPLRYVHDYLVMRGVTRPLRFVEGDSSAVVRAAAPHSFDLILIDHYKPKYPIDFYVLCSREALSADGRIVLHDVLTHAAPDWAVCRRVCRAFGYVWTIDADVPQGAAIVQRGAAGRSSVKVLAAGVEVRLRWWAHAAVLHTRRAIGRVLRRLGMRK